MELKSFKNPLTVLMIDLNIDMKEEEKCHTLHAFKDHFLTF